MDKIRMGVIGAGSMGKNHLRIISEIPEFELIGLFDTDSENARNAAQLYHVTAFSDLHGLLKAADAVSIAVPSSCHMKTAIAAAQEKRHIMLEKPIAQDAADARQIIDACGTAGVTLMIGHVERYNPVFIELKKVLSHERIFTVSFRRLSPFGARVSGDSVVHDLMIHDIDLLCAIIESPIARIASHGIRVYSDKPDFVRTLITFENGILADITASRITESKVRGAEAMAQNAYITADFLSRTVNIMRGARFLPDVERSMGYRQENIAEKVFVPMGEPLRGEFVHFAQCVRTGQPPTTGGESALKALLICEQITEGLKSGGLI